VKTHKLLAYGIGGAVLPFMALYLRHQANLDDASVGLVMGELGLGVLLGPIVLTQLADRLANMRWILASTYTAVCLALMALAMTQDFWWILILFLLFSLTHAAFTPLLDGLTFQVLARQSKGLRGHYYDVRKWGTLGFMIPALGLYFLLRFGDGNLALALWAGAGLALGGLALVYCVPTGGPRATGELPGLAALRQIRQGPTRWLLLFMLIARAGAWLHLTFYPLYLDELGMPGRWIGLVVQFGVLIELIFAQYALRMQNRIGLKGLMVVGVVFMSLRLALLGLAPSLTMALVTQLTHGIATIGLIFAPTVYIDHHAAPTHRNSIQGLFTMLTGGAAMLIGTVAAGQISEWASLWSDSDLFGTCSVFVFGSALLLIAAIGLTIFIPEDTPQHAQATSTEATEPTAPARE
jgi:PPP family 3-phenylpropionic acid transporter